MKITWLLGILVVSCSTVAGQRYGRRFGRRSMEFLTMEEQIFRNITAGMRHLRPVEKSSDTVNVTFRLSLLNILQVDEKNGFMIFDAWTIFRWAAPNLMWEPSDYDGVDKINIPIDKIWQPDISLYNGGLDAMKYGSTYAVVNSTGYVLWFPPVTIKTTCKSNMRNFPFDTQECVAIFGSWSYHGYEMSLDVKGKSVRLRYDNAEWHLYNSSFERKVEIYACCPMPYHSLQLSLYLKRRSTFFSYVYISPMVLIALMSPFMFLLPYQQSQRFSLGGSLLICLIVLLVGLDFVFPATTTGLPLISMYYMSIICLLLGAMIVSAVILNMAEKNSDPPQILKTIIGNGLGSVLMVRKENYSNLVEGEDEDELKAKKQDEVTWRYIATILDRFFFFVYIVLTIILSIAFTIPR